MSSEVLVALAPLFVGAVLLRALPRSGPAEGWSWRVDAPLALACAGVAAWLAAFVLHPFNFHGVAVDGSDHNQYCVVVRHLHDGVLRDAAGGQRSGVAAMLPGWLSHAVGLYDALAWAALLSFGVLAAAAYTWARAFGGRVGGVAAALACAGAELVTTLPRNLTFYPEISATSVLAAAGAAWALARAGYGASAFAGSAVGLVLLIDVRGLVWALPCFCVAMLGALLPSEGGRRWLRVALLLGPIALSWPLARFAWHRDAATLEAHTHTWSTVARPDHRMPPPPDVPHGGYRWGASSPLRIPATLRYLATSGVGEPTRALNEVDARTATRVKETLLPTMAALGAVALAGLLLRWRAAFALVATSVPFVTALVQATTWLPQTRYLTTGLLLVPVLLGVALGGLAESRRVTTPLRPWVEATKLALVAALVLAAVLGHLPSPLDPRTPGRLRAGDGAELVALVRRVEAGTPTPAEAACAAAVTAWPAPFHVALYDLDLATAEMTGGER